MDAAAWERQLTKSERVLTAVLDDVWQCIRELREAGRAAEDDASFWRRTLVRTLFAAVESGVHHLKQTALLAADSDGLPLRDGERGLLKERVYTLNGRGGIESRSFPPAIGANLLFTVESLARIAEIDFALDTGRDPGWVAFQEAVAVHGRLMHPEEPDDLRVTDSDLRHVLRAAAWFAGGMVRLGETVGAARTNPLPRNGASG